MNTIFNQYIDVVMVTNLYDFSFNMMEVESDFFLTQNNIFFEAYIPYVCAYLIEGMVTKMPRFMLEVPRTVHNLLFCTHTLCTCYVIKTFLLASFSPVSSKQLFCFVHDQDKKGEQKHATINFAEFHNLSFLLTMVYVSLK